MNAVAAEGNCKRPGRCFATSPQRVPNYFHHQPPLDHINQYAMDSMQGPTTDSAPEVMYDPNLDPSQEQVSAGGPLPKPLKKGVKAPAVDDPNKKRPSNKGKKHSTVYQKNALYGAYRFWRKKSDDLKARGLDVSFDWKELFEFFDFSKTTGFKVIRDADQDPSSLLKRDDSGKVETRGRKPKMGPEQIQQVETILDGKDPFQEGIEWKHIARQLGLEVHKHTVRRTMQARRKSAIANTPAKSPAITPATNSTTRRAATANMVPMNGQLPLTPTQAQMIDPNLSNHPMLPPDRPPYTDQEMTEILEHANAS